MNGMEDSFDHMVTCYFNEETLEMNEWNVEETYTVFNYIANMRTITITTTTSYKIRIIY